MGMSGDDVDAGAKTGGLGIWGFIIAIGVISAVGTLLGQATGSLVFSKPQEPAAEATEAIVENNQAADVSAIASPVPSTSTASAAEVMATRMVNEAIPQLPIAYSEYLILFNVVSEKNRYFMQHRFTESAYVDSQTLLEIEGKSHQAACLPEKWRNFIEIGGKIYFEYYLNNQLVKQVGVVSC